MKQIYKEYGNESINMFLCDFPYTFKGKQRVTANAWDLPIDDKSFFELALKLLTPNGVIVLTASQPFTSYLVMNHLDCFKYEWIWEKDNGSNFVHVKHQPFKVHESVLIFGKAPTTYNKAEKYMIYNPQFTYGKPYSMNRDGSDVENLQGFNGRTNTINEDGKRYPRSVQKVNLERGLHPTQKPTKLFKFFIETYTNIGDIVVDICAGSGTTAISALECKRNFIVNDNNNKYYDIITNRIQKVLEEKNVEIL
jgi:site-specific DNA-methyltransferase (adenine-specific)